jgi:hypothetical protein
MLLIGNLTPLKPSSPALLPGNSNDVVVASGPRADAGTAVKLDRVMPAEGEMQGLLQRANSVVDYQLLRVVLPSRR